MKNIKYKKNLNNLWGRGRYCTNENNDDKDRKVTAPMRTMMTKIGRQQ